MQVKLQGIGLHPFLHDFMHDGGHFRPLVYRAISWFVVVGLW